MPISQTEKRGNICHPFNLIKGFREAVEECDLEEVNMIKEKLDIQSSLVDKKEVVPTLHIYLCCE